MLKKIGILLLVLGVTACLLCGVDTYRITHNNKPLVSFPLVVYDDGESCEWYGFGYKYIQYYNPLKDSSEYKLGWLWDKFDHEYYQKQMCSSFYGVIVDEDETHWFVSPFPEQLEHSVCDRYVLNKSYAMDAEPDDVLLIDYKGKIEPVYPARISVTKAQCLPNVLHEETSFAEQTDSSFTQSTYYITSGYELSRFTDLYGMDPIVYEDGFCYLVIETYENHLDTQAVIEKIYVQDNVLQIRIRRITPTEGLMASYRHLSIVRLSSDYSQKEVNIYYCSN
ncbi:MAG: hypothetical protein HUJ58_05890 [Erysipelotrichaceae bacterium]|nr:hypothetical protein [Erysipelotrichaceae bacterium]